MCTLPNLVRKSLWLTTTKTDSRIHSLTQQENIMKSQKYSYIDSFRDGDNFFTHVIDTSTDETHCIDSEDNIVFTVSSFADLFDKNGVSLGSFSLKRTGPYSPQYEWEFTGSNGVKIQNPYKNKTDLIAFELEIFKSLVKGNNDT